MVLTDNKSNSDEVEPQEFTLKVILLGESNAGKTSLESRITRDVFYVETHATIGVSFGLRNVTLSNGHKARVQVCLMPTCYKNLFLQYTLIYMLRTLY